MRVRTVRSRQPQEILATASGHNANEFSWLPQRMPPRLRVVISCITEDAAALQGLYWRYPLLKEPSNVVLLQPLQMAARLEIVSSTLG